MCEKFKIIDMYPIFTYTFDNYEQVELLLKYKGDPTRRYHTQWSRSHRGEDSPYEVAKKRGLTNIVELMDKYINT